VVALRTSGLRQVLVDDTTVATQPRPSARIRRSRPGTFFRYPDNSAVNEPLGGTRTRYPLHIKSISVNT
jgi:hypothetical protein